MQVSFLKIGDLMPFIGRSKELDRILSLIHGPKDSALVVAGRHGVGKSALLSEIPGLSEYRTVSLEASDSESDWSFSGLTALLDGIDDPALTMAGDERLLHPAGAADIPAISSMLLHQLGHTTSARTVVIIDDADLLDLASQAVIGFLARRMSGTNLAMILSVRGETPSGPFTNLPVLQLEPLNYNDTIRMLEAVPVRASSPAAIQAVAAAVQGNPLAAFELYTCLLKRQSGGEYALPIPLPCTPSFASAHAADVSVLTPVARHVLDLLSLSRRSGIAVLEQVDPAMLCGVEELLLHGMVHRTGQHLQIRDQLLRAYVFAAMTAETRAANHASLAKAADVVDAAACRWHLSFCATNRQTPFGLLRGAVYLIRDGECAFAVECIERALTLNPWEAETAARLATLAEMLFVRGEFVYAKRYLDWARRVTRDPGLVFRLTGLAFQIQFMQDTSVRSSMVLRLVKEFGHHDPAFSACLLACASIYYADRWQHEDAQKMLESAGQYQDAASSEWAAVLRIAKTMIDSTTGKTGNLQDNYDGTGSRFGLALLAEGRALTYAGGHHHAREVFAMVQASTDARNTNWSETAAVLAVDNEIRAGQVRAAVKLIDNLELHEPESECHRGKRHIFRVWRAQSLGNEALAKEHVLESQHFAASESYPAMSAQLAACQGHFALIRGNLAEALAQLSRAVEIGSRFGIPTLLGCESDLVEVLIRLGRHQEATHTQFRLESRSIGLRSVRLTTAIARSRAMLADGEHSLRLFGHAMAGGHTSYCVLEKARTLLCFGERLRAFGRVKEAHEAFLRAKVLFDEVGADAWTQQVDFLLLDKRMEPARESASPALLILEDHERALAKMVARGMRNKEIAASLYISVRTVEVRLTAIYRKLGVESRAQLTALAAGAGAAREAYVLPVLTP